MSDKSACQKEDKKENYFTDIIFHQHFHTHHHIKCTPSSFVYLHSMENDLIKINFNLYTRNIRTNHCPSSPNQKQLSFS